MKRLSLIAVLAAITLLCAACAGREKVSDAGNKSDAGKVTTTAPESATEPGQATTESVATTEQAETESGQATTESAATTGQAETEPGQATPESTVTPEPTATPEPTPTEVPVSGFEAEDMLPAFCYKDYSGECGTIELISYMSHDYQADGDDVEKKAYVYLPAGYDETKQYNVIYLMHGIGGSEREWGLNKPDESRVKKILDHLIGEGTIEPVIVVTPNGKALAQSNASGNDRFYVFGLELKNDLIPYMESHYATYADYNEDGYDMTATRTHRAMAGLSMGGMQTINIGMCENLDLFSWFGAFSAAPTSYESAKVAKIVSESEYDVDYFYNICGTEDNIAYWSAAAAAKDIPSKSDKFTEGENFMWQERSGAHDFNIWYLGFYNFVRIAFTK